MAARVNGVPIAHALVGLLLTPSDVAGAADAAEGDTPNDTLDALRQTGLVGNDARDALTGLIQTRVAQSVAADFGVDLTASRTAVKGQIEPNLTPARRKQWDALSESSRTLLLDYGAAIDAIGAVTAPPPSNLEQQYRDPEQTGFMCLRFMALASEEAAVAADAQLDTGASFADVANQLNPQSNGGIVTAQDGTPCVRLDELDPTTLPVEITAALLSATPGLATGVVRAEYSEGPQWFIFLHRPYDEIKDDLAAAVGAAPALAAYYGALTQANVSVASQYGRWDPVLRAVVALG